MAGPTSYQRVNTATDYDTVGQSHYLKFDGVDDFLVTRSINFTATDKMTVWAGVTKLSDAAIAEILELSAESSTNNGAFQLQSRNNPSYAIGHRGTTSAELYGTATNYPSPISNVLATSYDLAGATISDRLKLRIDGASVALPTALIAGPTSQANYGTYPLYIGRRGGTTFPFNGQLNQLIVRGASSTNTQIEYCEDYIASKTGVTLP